MKVRRIFPPILLISIIFWQCQTEIKKIEYDVLPIEVIETIDKRISQGLNMSIAIAIIDQNGVRYFNFGKTSVKGKDVDENTIYEIGSITKVFTGILLAQQVLDVDLKLDDKINDYLPDEVKVPVMGEKEITFGNLTDHTSGLPRMPPNFDNFTSLNSYAEFTVNQMYEFISNYQPTRTVGSGFEYSNLAQGLLGHLLAENKNTTYEKLMIQTIALPLEMNDTKIEFDQRMRDNLALGHAGREVMENMYLPAIVGAGAIRSSTSDLAKFISANMGNIENPLIPAMELSHLERHDKANNKGVGMGWIIKKGKRGDVISHAGGTYGYRAFAGFIKESHIGVVVLTNSFIGVDDIGQHLLDPSSKLKKVKTKEEAIEINDTTLEKYVGVYEINPELMLSLTLEESQLYAQATGQQKYKIYGETETVFFLTISEAKIEFMFSNDVVTSLLFTDFGQTMRVEKIE